MTSTRPGGAHVVFVRSSIAHGVLRSVEVDEARAMPGVLAVYHAAGDDLGLAAFQSFPMIAETFNRPVFARERVRFVGDIVAAVVAETGAARQSTPPRPSWSTSTRCPPVVTQADALRPEAPLLFPEAGSNVCFGTVVRRSTRTRSREPRSWPRSTW